MYDSGRTDISIFACWHGPTVMLLMYCYIRNKFCLNQPRNSIGRLSSESDAAAQTNRRPATAGTLGERGRGGPSARFNTLDNWGHTIPTQSKKEKGRQERI